MQQIKTSNLIDATLDYAVALALGKRPSLFIYQLTGKLAKEHQYSTDWNQGGNIINSIKGFEMKQWLESKPATCCEAHIHDYEGDWIQFGPTPLIAAMRVFVASKLGEFVNIPA